MGEFTYNVFLVVASLAGALITVFTAGILAVLASDAPPHPAGRTATVDADRAELPRAA